MPMPDADRRSPECDCGSEYVETEAPTLAYSGPNRSLIPVQTDHRFRSKPITDFG